MNIGGFNPLAGRTAAAGARPLGEGTVPPDATPGRKAQASTMSVSSRQVTDTGLDALSGIGEVADSDLRRDDDLGRLFSRAFAFPPPEFPKA